MRLAEASQQQHYNRGDEDLELWLSEVEDQLLSEDYGNDLITAQNLQKKIGKSDPYAVMSLRNDKMNQSQ